MFCFFYVLPVSHKMQHNAEFPKNSTFCLISLQNNLPKTLEITKMFLKHDIPRKFPRLFSLYMNSCFSDILRSLRNSYVTFSRLMGISDFESLLYLNFFRLGHYELVIEVFTILCVVRKVLYNALEISRPGCCNVI